MAYQMQKMGSAPVHLNKTTFVKIKICKPLQQREWGRWKVFKRLLMYNVHLIQARDHIKKFHDWIYSEEKDQDGSAGTEDRC